jgi:integrase
MGLSPGGASGIPQLKIYMSLYRRGRVWWLELTSNGRRLRESTGTADKKAAQEYHEKRKGELWRQARLGEAPPVTWGEAVAAWLKVKPRSLPERYMISALSIKPSETLPLSSGLLSEKLKGSSAGSHNRIRGLIVSIHSCVKAQSPDLDPLPTPPGRTRWLTAEEWARLLKALDQESPLLGQMARFAVATGLRENNVLNLEWSQIDSQRRVAWWWADQVKGRVPHGLPLNDDAWAVLDARRGIHKKYVFPNPDTDLPYVKASNRAWYAAVKKAKLKGVRWHDLRHTWASWAVMNGVPLPEVQRLGGWKTAQMVQRYAHFSTEHLAESAAKVKPISLSYNARKRGKRGTKSPTVGA